MATKREAIMQASHTLLSGLSGPTVLRNANLPERVPSGGIIIVLVIGSAIASDRVLGGPCDFAETAAPVPVDVIVEGAPGFKVATLWIILHYGTSDPLS